MPTERPSDSLFQAIREAAFALPQLGEVTLRSLLRQAREGQRPWHVAYAQAELSRRLTAREHDEALQLADAAWAGFEAQDCDWGRSNALSAKAHVLVQRGEVHRGLDLYLASVALARRTGEAACLVNRLANTAFALGLLDQYEGAVTLNEEAFALIDQLAPATRVTVASNFAASLVELARRECSAGVAPALWQPRAQRAVEVLHGYLPGDLPEAGALGAKPYRWGNLAAALVLLDQHERARRIFAVLLPHYVAGGDLHAQSFVHRHLGWSHLQCGEWAPALACAHAHHELVRASGRSAVEHRGLEIEALALEQAGRWQEALAVFKRFHASHARHVLAQAEEKARSLAVSMQTDRALRESQLDALTELPNRRAFDAAVARAVADAGVRPQSLVLIDLDHFKQINDRHGHAAGDAVLRALAGVMKRSSRSGDLPARLGGDEFAVLVFADTAAALQLAQRLRAELGVWEPTAADMARPTLSIGVAPLVAGMTAADWLAAADGALYAAKAAGRDGVQLHRAGEVDVPGRDQTGEPAAPAAPSEADAAGR